jgi:hypothetical protein
VGLYIGNVNSSTRLSSNIRKASLEDDGENQNAEAADRISSSYTHDGTPLKRDVEPVVVIWIGEDDLGEQMSAQQQKLELMRTSATVECRGHFP